MPKRVSGSDSARAEKGEVTIVEHLLCEPVELTELELDAVSGGNPFSITSAGSVVSQWLIITNRSTNVILNYINNSINISL